MFLKLIGKMYVNLKLVFYSEVADVMIQAFFGTNYQTLLNIKQKYDPQNILNVWKGVGWTGQSDSAYKCYSQA